jgi:hypothetical protein
MLMIFVHAACPQPVAFWTTGSFVNGMLKKPPTTPPASLMAMVMVVMANLTRDTVAKASNRFRRSIEAVVEAGGNFSED